MSDISKEIIDIFTKKLPKIFKNSEIRKNQVQMSLDVADFLFNRREKVMFVEAPVGTGKSLGLLIPAAIYSRENKVKTIYATATINLQNQIFEKDSLVLEKLNLINDSEKILAQGKSHYMCKTFFEKNEKQFSREESKQLKHFFEVCKFGLFSELYAFFPNFDRRKERYLSLNLIQNHECMSSFNCKGHIHRKKYSSKKNKLIITNHDQLMQSYFNTQEQRSPIVSFDDGILIIDEAHFLKETFLGRLSKDFKFNEFPNPHSRIIKKNTQKYKLIWEKFFGLSENFSSNDVFESNARVNISNDDIELLEEMYGILYDNLIDIEISLTTEHFSHYISVQADRLEKLLVKIEEFLHSGNKKWLEFNKGLSFHSVTNSFNHEFNKMLDRFPNISKVIFMSGTLTTGEPAQDIKINWNMEKEYYVYKSYPSIFDLKRQAIVYIPQNIAHPNAGNEHLKNISSQIPNLYNLYSGGALVLCTSNSYVREISAFLKNCSSIEENIYSQNEGEVSDLSKNFTNNINSILVGSGSFFTGFSVEGKSLNKLFLSKLPYPVHTDPYIELISQGYSDKETFTNIIEPTMLKKLEQGLGRLIRSTKDFGFITIFDSRIKTGTIAYKYINSLGYSIVTEVNEITDFVENFYQTNEDGTSRETFDVRQLYIPEIQVTLEDPTFSKRVPKPIINKNTGLIIQTKAVSVEELQDWLRNFVKIHKGDTTNKASIIQYKRLRDPKTVYEKAINFCYQKGIDYHLVVENFPFQNSSQRNNFINISPSSVSPVKIEKLV